MEAELKLKVDFSREMGQDAIFEKGDFNPLYIKWLEIRYLKAINALAKLTDAVKKAKVKL